MWQALVFSFVCLMISISIQYSAARALRRMDNEEIDA